MSGKVLAANSLMQTDLLILQSDNFVFNVYKFVSDTAVVTFTEFSGKLCRFDKNLFFLDDKFLL